VKVTTSGPFTAPTSFDLGGHSLRDGDLLATDAVRALHDAGVVWDTAQGWFVNRRVAFKPASEARFVVVDLARLH
jgi:hypothetical protein